MNKHDSDQCCECGSGDVSASSSLYGAFCGPCWKEYQKEKAERKARKGETMRSDKGDPNVTIHDSLCRCPLCITRTGDTPPDPYPPFSDAEIGRLDKFYADERSGINANERRRLANVRVLKAELARLRDTKDGKLCDCCGEALLDIVNDFVEEDTGRNPLAERVVQLEKELADRVKADAILRETIRRFDSEICVLNARVAIRDNQLAELRASRARLMDPVVDPMNALHEQYCDEQSQLPTEESFEAWVKKHNAARQKV